jgi:hypothetical protein|tara:strand:+ start:1495 stop:1761 length:267 start_codon:yes stop_codon:yes gene_type:complete
LTQWEKNAILGVQLIKEETPMEQLTFENIETDNKPRIVDLNYKIKVACINTDVDWLIPISQLDEDIFTDEQWFALTRAIQKYIEDYSK